LTTHAIVYRNGKQWFTQHHTGHPDYTGRLLLSLRRKYGIITPLHIKRYFDPCSENSGEFEYDIRNDGIYYRVSPGAMTLFLKVPSKAEQESARRERNWRKLTTRFTGRLGDIDAFLQENVHLALKKENPALEKQLGIPASKFKIGTKFYQHFSVNYDFKKKRLVRKSTDPGIVTGKHYDRQQWWYDVGNCCYSETNVSQNLIK